MSPGYTPILHNDGTTDTHVCKTADTLLVVTYCLPSLCWTGFYSSEKMSGVFSYESSEIDWCEDNYKHSEHVVEYFNTVSSASLCQNSCTYIFIGNN